MFLFYAITGFIAGTVLVIVGILAMFYPGALRGVDLSSVGESGVARQSPSRLLSFAIGAFLATLGHAVLGNTLDRLHYRGHQLGDIVAWAGKEAKVIGLSGGALEIRLPDNTVTKILAEEIDSEAKK